MKCSEQLEKRKRKKKREAKGQQRFSANPDVYGFSILQDSVSWAYIKLKLGHIRNATRATLHPRGVTRLRQTKVRF